MSDAPAPAASSFLAFLRRGADAGGFGTEDVLGAVLPLLEQVVLAHQQDQIAPLDGFAAVRVEDGVLTFDPAGLRGFFVGVAESSALAFFAFACLTAAWLCVAAGMRKLS